MPTYVENRTFFGNESGSNDTAYSTWTANGRNESDPATRTFHKSDPANAILPAAGWRGSSGGTVNNRGTRGYYWSSTPNDASYGYYLYVYRTLVYPASYTYYYYGFTVRCVPAQEFVTCFNSSYHYYEEMWMKQLCRKYF
jgi:hypothetical protein